MIYEGSRYEDSEIVAVRDKGGSPAQAVYPFATLNALFDYSRYITKEGDRWDLIAWRFLGDPEEWWRIAEANPEIYFPDRSIPANTVLRIPSGPIIRR